MGDALAIALLEKRNFTKEDFAMFHPGGSLGKRLLLKVEEIMVAGSDVPVDLMYVEVWDGLYAPIGVRRPEGEGPFPIILLASGNGGGGMAWVRDAVANKGYIMECLLDAGYACAWLRYRSEVELGYHEGGTLIRDMRQGRDLFNRSPLEYEDEIAIIDHLKTLPWVDGDRVGLIGMSHGGEMVLKITSEYDGVAAAIASEPASHEFLALTPDDTAFVNEETQLRNIEGIKLRGGQRGNPPFLGLL